LLRIDSITISPSRGIRSRQVPERIEGSTLAEQRLTVEIFRHIRNVADAREAAARSAAPWRDGEPLGALDGVPVTFKDLISAL